MSPTETVLAALRSTGIEPKRSNGGWTCRCPAHDDRKPSLSIGTGDDGRALVKCFAGCSAEQVVGAIGLHLSDLMPGDRRGLHCARRRSDGDTSGAEGGAGATSVAVAGDAPPAFAAAAEAVGRLERTLGPRSQAWTYTDETGEPVGLVVRWDTPNGKEIRPVSRCGDGWRIAGMPAPRPLYRLADLVGAPRGSRVFVTEGEKAADAARSLGMLATTSPHGSESADQACWSPLEQQDIVILADHDDPGEKYATDVVRHAFTVGVRSVRIVRLADAWAGMPQGGDIVDLIEHRGGDAEAALADVEALIALAEPEKHPAEARPGRFRPFPVDVLPEPVASFVEEASKAIGCDACYVALPLLAGLAAAIGNTRRLQLKRTWSEPAIIWAVIVAESGTVKSPALELALEPVRARQQRAMKAHADELRDWERLRTCWEIDFAQWRKAAQAGDSAGDPPPEPARPVCERTWIDDVTTEAVVQRLQENPRGLLMVRDELSGWFNFDRYAGGKGGGDAAKWLEVFGGRALMVDRKSSETVFVPRASVSIAGCIQPGMLLRSLGQEHRDNGLAARILFAQPPRHPKRWTEDEVDEGTEAALVSVFEALYSLQPDQNEDGDPSPRLVRLSAEARRAWVRFVNEHGAQTDERIGDEAAAWSKLEGYAARLALVVHLVRVAAGDRSIPDPDQVDKLSVHAGVELVRWFAHEAERVYATLGGDEADRAQARLVDWIDGRGGAVTVRDLTRGPSEFRGNQDRANAALNSLVEAGLGRWEPNTGGRTMLFRLHGGDGDTFTPGEVGKAVGRE